MKHLIAALLACGMLGATAPARAETQGEVLVDVIFDELERAILREYGVTDDARDRYRRQRQYRGPDHVPPGHMPPPGLCRAWVFGQPPGHQAPPGDCATVAATMPHDAELIYGGAAQGTRLPSIFGAALPPDVLDRLPRRQGAERVVVGDDIVLVDRTTRIILDVLAGVIRQN